MKYIDFSFTKPAENLAGDEALLDWSEAGHGGETLRFWESQAPFVVVGYANKAASEANLAACEANGVPVFRRCTGGGTVLQGPGCLNYSLVLEIKEARSTQSITSTNNLVMGRHRTALQSLVKRIVSIEGHTDLAVGNLKFSGNAQRRKRKFLIFHGTFLLNFDLALIERFLRMPSQQPEYRQERRHSDFLTNLGVSADAVKLALRRVWETEEEMGEMPMGDVVKLAEKYTTTEWHFKF